MMTIRRSLQIHHKLRHYCFAAPNCRKLRTMEKVKIAFDLAHLFTRTRWAQERKQKQKLGVLLYLRSPLC